MRKLRVAVLGSTNGTDMQALIDAIAAKELDAEIVLVVSDKKDARILEKARRHGIPAHFADYRLFTSREAAEKGIAAKLHEKNAELVLLIGFMKIISPFLVKEFRARMWNIHPSLLPKFAGAINMDAHKEILKAGEKESGCTLHEVSEEVDRGKIIMQKKVLIEKGETPESLKDKVQKLEQQCILEAVKRVIEGKLVIGEQS